MGAKSISSQLSINHQEWISLPLNSHYRNDYGKYHIYENKVSGKAIQKYDIFINDQQQFQQFQKILHWRNQCEYVVGIDFHQFQRQQEICSSGYNGQIFIPHIPLRLSDITDIPYPENLYVLHATLKGFQYIYSFPYRLHGFSINQHLVCINEKGQIKVWMNSNLSYSYPDPLRKQHITQQQMLRLIIQLIEQNTDAQGNAYPFRQYLNNRKVIVNGDFDQIIRQLHIYSQQMKTRIPNSLQSVKQLLNSNCGNIAKLNQNLVNRNQNIPQDFSYKTQDKIRKDNFIANTNNQIDQEIQQHMLKTIRPLRQQQKIQEFKFQNNLLPIKYGHYYQQDIYATNSKQNKQVIINNRDGEILQTPSFGMIKDQNHDKRMRSISQNQGSSQFYPYKGNQPSTYKGNTFFPFQRHVNQQINNYISQYNNPQRNIEYPPRLLIQPNRRYQFKYGPEINLTINKPARQISLMKQNKINYQPTSLNYPNNQQRVFQKNNNLAFNMQQNNLQKVSVNSLHHNIQPHFQNCKFSYQPCQVSYQPIPTRQPILYQGSQFNQRSHPTTRSLSIQSNKNAGQYSPVLIHHSSFNQSIINNNQNRNAIRIKQKVEQNPVNIERKILKNSENNQLTQYPSQIHNSNDLKYFLNKNEEQILDPDIAADLAKYLKQS